MIKVIIIFNLLSSPGAEKIRRGRGAIIRFVCEALSRKFRIFLMLIMKVKSYQINKVQMLTACNGSILVYNSCIVYLTYYRYKLLNKKTLCSGMFQISWVLNIVVQG